VKHVNSPNACYSVRACGVKICNMDNGFPVAALICPPHEDVIQTSLTAGSNCEAPMAVRLVEHSQGTTASMRPFICRSLSSHVSAVRRPGVASRAYAIQAPGSPTLQVFNRHTKYLQKERAASDVQQSRDADYMRDEVAIRLTGRLLVNLERFEQIENVVVMEIGYQSPPS
jgi:hypothetical protein